MPIFFVNICPLVYLVFNLLVGYVHICRTNCGYLQFVDQARQCKLEMCFQLKKIYFVKEDLFLFPFNYIIFLLYAL